MCVDLNEMVAIGALDLGRMAHYAEWEEVARYSIPRERRLEVLDPKATETIIAEECVVCGVEMSRLKSITWDRRIVVAYIGLGRFEDRDDLRSVIDSAGMEVWYE